TIFTRTTYYLVETSPAMRARQEHMLEEFRSLVQWTDFSELERCPITGVVFSNELIDALPVHRIRVSAGRIEEQYVRTREQAGREVQTGDEKSEQPDELELCWGPPTTPELQDYVERLRITLAEQRILEVNLGAIEW